MKKKILLSVLSLIGIIVAGANIIPKYNNDNNIDAEKILEEKEEKVNLDVLELNHIAVCADEFDIDSVGFDEEVEEKLVDSVDVYKVSAKKYNDNDVSEIVKRGFGTNVIDILEDENVKLYKLANGNDITYYENSGTLSYNDRNEKEDSSVKVIETEKLKRNAEKFIKRTGIWSIDELEFYRANPSVILQEGDVDRIQRYEVIFTKKTPSGIDGFDGTGPGIIVELNCKGKVIGFVSIYKNFELCQNEYPAKNVDEIEEDIIDSKNVMIFSNSEIDKEINVDDVEYVLYSDSIDEVQDYMVTHYRLKSDDDLEIVIPAIDDDYISIKR